ncbi:MULTISPECIES: osmoprotectant ABC transporter substrate-binding protein [Clostridia]|uniref:osmoprotectant ABC transporter substrate-binding protein n=1 Tax=Clostridia TaxID=186801 RepID=UPI000EA32E41|nr:MULTISPECIES: osmoprotectant ABC transporter substrate-binding protein [Clostridia]NBJ69501.1 osmoprotectant ABC transporter substrate-binding protein [Roseburia sp. 1XD42-34]RKI78575.1 osmoprotectant ABC transporter substrate-binding protein [Clostridium sp. 1xD42-85]
MFKSKKKLVIITTILLLLSGCSLPGLSGSSKETIKIGTLNNSESMTIGYIIKQLIEHKTDYHAEIIGNMGSSIVQHQALEQGEVDITGTRYTGTDLPGTLQMDLVTDTDKALKIVQREFEERFDQTWFDPYGFENSYAFTVTNKLAEEKNLQKVSDIEPYAADLRLGVDNAWLNREGDGYQGFIDTYGFEFGKAYPMQIGLVYQAVASGNMDVVLAYTTDGRIEAFDLVSLEDDKNFFPPYDASPVARNDILKSHPEVKDILESLAGKIDEKTMRYMNYEADVKMKEPYIVAKEFLEEHHYFENE